LSLFRYFEVGLRVCDIVVKKFTFAISSPDEFLYHMVIKSFLLLGLAAENKCRQWVWSTVVRRPSELYDIYQRTKLTATERISHSRNMIVAHQNLNGSRDLATPLSGMVCHPWASSYYRQPTYQIWSLYLHSLRRYERRHKMSKMGWFGVVMVSQGHQK